MYAAQPEELCAKTVKTRQRKIVAIEGAGLVAKVEVLIAPLT